MFDFEGDDDFDTLSALRDYEGVGDGAGQVQPGRWDAYLGGPGAGGYLDAPAASQEAAQTDAARAERDRLAAEEIARREAEDAERWAQEDADAAARDPTIVGGQTVVVDDRGGRARRVEDVRAKSVTGGDSYTPEELARAQADRARAVREAEIRAAQRNLQRDLQKGVEDLGRGGGYGSGAQQGGVSSGALGRDAQKIVDRFASGEYRQPEGSLGRLLSDSPLGDLVGGLGGLVSGLPGALASLFLGQQASGLSGLLANVLGAADSSATNLELARRLAAQVLGVTVPQLDELQRYVMEQRAQWDATAEHRALMSQEQFRNDLLTRMWSVEEQLRRLQGSVDMIGPARW